MSITYVVDRPTPAQEERMKWVLQSCGAVGATCFGVSLLRLGWDLVFRKNCASALAHFGSNIGSSLIITSVSLCPFMAIFQPMSFKSITYDPHGKHGERTWIHLR